MYLEKKENYTEVYPIIVNGNESVWRWGKNEKASRQINDLVGRKGSDGIIRIYQKMRKLTEMPKTVLIDKEFISIKGTRELQEILGLGVFDFPKPSKLIKFFLSISSNPDSIILDFFSGSATTAHAVMQLNAEDGGHRKFIMVQIPEKTNEKSEAFKAGYKNVCEIGKERIRRAGKKIKESLEKDGMDIRHINKELQKGEQMILPTGEIVPKISARWGAGDETEDNKKIADSLDIGFRVLKVDESNMTDVYYSPLEINQQMLLEQVENIKPDRTDLDLLFGCLIDWGIPLNLPYVSENIDGCNVHTYNDGDLIACFDKNVPESVIREIAKRQPLRAVFRDSSFADSPAKINVEEIFKMIAPDTRVRVI
ncbi:MAG: DNA methyltransferase [Porcipelethomonas sp.]